MLGEHDQIADFRNWTSWSPWEGLDPDLERSYSGAESGAGAVYGWSGNRKAGQGHMEIIEADQPTRVEIDLTFEKPWKSRNDTVFVIDIDRFKQVNDGLGMSAGDTMLLTIARRLHRLLKPKDSLSRIAGDLGIVEPGARTLGGPAWLDWYAAFPWEDHRPDPSGTSPGARLVGEAGEHLEPDLVLHRQRHRAQRDALEAHGRAGGRLARQEPDRSAPRDVRA